MTKSSSFGCFFAIVSKSLKMTTKVESLILDEPSSISLENEENVNFSFSAIQSEDDDTISLESDSTYEDSKPLYIENTDLSLTRLVPKQGVHSGRLSSLQWTFIILIIGAVLFYGGIMFIASKGTPEIAPIAETDFGDPATLEVVQIENEQAIAEESNEVPTDDSATTAVIVESPSITERISAFFSSFGSDSTSDIAPDEAEIHSALPEVSDIAHNSGTAESQKENTIHALLNLAQVQMENKKLTSPPSDNALDTYRMVLQLDPGNKAAASGVESIRVRYLIWAEQQAMAGNSGQAKFYLERAMEMAAEDK